MFSRYNIMRNKHNKFHLRNMPFQESELTSVSDWSFWARWKACDLLKRHKVLLSLKLPYLLRYKAWKKSLPTTLNGVPQGQLLSLKTLKEVWKHCDNPFTYCSLAIPALDSSMFQMPHTQFPVQNFYSNNIKTLKTVKIILNHPNIFVESATEALLKCHHIIHVLVQLCSC